MDFVLKNEPGAPLADPAHRFPRGSQRGAVRRRHRAARAAARAGRRRLRQDAHPHLPRGPPALPGRAPARDPPAHLHQQGRAGDAPPRAGPHRRRGPPLLGRHVPPHRPQGAAHLRRGRRPAALASPSSTPRRPTACCATRSRRRTRSSSRTRPIPRPGPLFEIISFARNTQRALGETITPVLPAARGRGRPRSAASPRPTASASAGQNVVDYDDLLEYWLDLLEAAPDVAAYLQQRFRHTLVDEYQDTNTLQAQIVDIVGAHHRIMAVGDDAQCIYSWRGANFENIITFPDRHPGTHDLPHRDQLPLDAADPRLRQRRARRPAQGPPLRQGAAPVAPRPREAVPGPGDGHARAGHVRGAARQGARRRGPAAGRHRRSSTARISTRSTCSSSSRASGSPM